MVDFVNNARLVSSNVTGISENAFQCSGATDPSTSSNHVIVLDYVMREGDQFRINNVTGFNAGSFFSLDMGLVTSSYDFPPLPAGDTTLGNHRQSIRARMNNDSTSRLDINDSSTDQNPAPTVITGRSWLGVPDFNPIDMTFRVSVKDDVQQEVQIFVNDNISPAQTIVMDPTVDLNPFVQVEVAPNPFDDEDWFVADFSGLDATPAVPVVCVGPTAEPVLALQPLNLINSVLATATELTISSTGRSIRSAHVDPALQRTIQMNTPLRPGHAIRAEYPTGLPTDGTSCTVGGLGFGTDDVNVLSSTAVGFQPMSHYFTMDHADNTSGIFGNNSASVQDEDDIDVDEPYLENRPPTVVEFRVSSGDFDDEYWIDWYVNDSPQPFFSDTIDSTVDWYPIFGATTKDAGGSNIWALNVDLAKLTISPVGRDLTVDMQTGTQILGALNPANCAVTLPPPPIQYSIVRQVQTAYSLRSSTLEEMATSLAAYLPNDKVWASKLIPGSGLRKYLRFLSGELLRAENSILDYLRETDVGNTTAFIDRWERQLGIPDSIFDGRGDLATRRLHCQIKLLALGTKTENDYIELGRMLGFRIEFVYPDITDRLTFPYEFPIPFIDTGFELGVFHVRIFSQQGAENVFPLDFPIPFTVGNGNVLARLIRILAPAHAEVIIEFAEEEN